MYTFTAHAVGDSLLFRDWEEAAALWQQVSSRVPGLAGLVLMLTHLHLDHPLPDTSGLDQAMRSYALWRNAHRGRRGPVWEPRPPPRPLAGPQQAWRNLRSLHLNPCRTAVVPCPLAWPFSTHRDCLGLAAHPIRARARDPSAFHARFSADPCTAVDGTPLPCASLVDPRPPLHRLAAVVSEYARVPLSQVYQRGPPRTLFMAAARALTSWPATAIGRHLGVHGTTVSRVEPLDPPAAAALARMLPDARFPGLTDGDRRLVWSRIGRRAS